MKFRDLFTYQADVSGKRKMRTYVKAAIIILAALIVLWAVAYYQQSQQIRAIQETKPVVLPSPTPMIPQPPTFTPEPTAVTESCPTDPADWEFVEGIPGTEFQRIEPACVYKGLEKTIAWVLAISMGYSRQAATDALGFEKFPLEGSSPVTIVSPGGPIDVDVTFTPAVPDFIEWVFDDKEQAGKSLSLQGCFNTYTLAGLERQDWGKGYPVICRVAYDTEASNSLFCLDGHCFTSPIDTPAYRQFALFGYAGDGRWAWLGTETDSRAVFDSQTLQADRGASFQQQGVGPWDNDWLQSTYGLSMRVPPSNWKSFTDTAELQKILDGVNSYLEKVSP